MTTTFHPIPSPAHSSFPVASQPTTNNWIAHLRRTLLSTYLPTTSIFGARLPIRNRVEDAFIQGKTDRSQVARGGQGEYVAPTSSHSVYCRTSTDCIARLIEVKNETNKDGSGKGQWSAWKVNAILSICKIHIQLLLSRSHSCRARSSSRTRVIDTYRRRVLYAHGNCNDELF